MNLYVIKKSFNSTPYEFVERKGKGHPDTLSDNLAEFLSAKYSQFTKEKFGAILHHNFDKVGLLGGASFVSFGKGYLTSPIRVLLNGRASSKFGKHEISLKKLLIEWTIEFLTNALPIKNPQAELEFHYNISVQSSPGKTEEEENKKDSARNYWFTPRSLDDLPELKKLKSNDTSMGVGFAPLTKLEKFILEIERTLNSKEYKRNNLWIGSDIKIMGFRFRNKYKVTLCIPQIAKYVGNLNEYRTNIKAAEDVIRTLSNKNGIKSLEININTRDNYKTKELYLTAIGSSIESGDEGLVGRGNRVQGLITPTRLMSMEGAAGKNPVYHIGKIYYIAAQQISEKLYKSFNIKNEVVLISQSGRELVDPWIVFIHVPRSFTDLSKLESFVKMEIKHIPQLTDKIINLNIEIC